MLRHSPETNTILRRQVLFPFLASLFGCVLSEQIRYSIPEEMEKGSVVGNLAKDLGLNIPDLSLRKLRVTGEKKYFTVNADNGDLLVSNRIDREQICKKRQICELQLEVVVEKPLNIFHVVVTIQDINDHEPRFVRNELSLEISESVLPGARLVLESAEDPDVGFNALQFYQINSNPHFSVRVKDNPDGSKYPEMVVEKSLDREIQSSHHLILTAVDGGDPVLSGTTQIRIRVTDANDNPPIFSQDVYRANVSENLPPGSSVLQVTATDKDEGVNAEITFSFTRIAKDILSKFRLDPTTGEIIIKQTLDFEETKVYTMDIEAKDAGSLVAQCKVVLEVRDENDNVPEITLMSLSSTIPEDTVSGTVIALIKTYDRDSEENGEIVSHIERTVPFKIESSSKNYYKLLTDGVLDREQTPEYNITMTATDKGNPSLSTSKTISLYISDINDNPPIFLQSSYVVYVPENNPSGSCIARISATDLDLYENGHVSYSIFSSDLAPLSVSSYLSVSGDSGDLFAQRSFDYEQIRTFEMILQAQDGGTPSLRANVTLQVFILDRNDNSPNILFPPSEPDSSALFDMVPRSAEPGYLVTKVVAVDADSGHNAWLAYHVLQATDPGLFSLGLRTGEVRTARALTDRDASRHRLLVSVQDGGQPSLSATVTLHFVFADSLQEALPEMREERLHLSNSQSELQFYLVVALVLISMLFLMTVIVAIALRLRRSSTPKGWGCFRADLCSKSELNIPPNYSEGTLPYSYNLCVSSHPRNTEFNYLKSTDQCPPGLWMDTDVTSMLFKNNLNGDANCHSNSLSQVGFY